MLAVLAISGCAEDGTCMGVCGDGVLDPFEECDDGNNDDGDGCDADCEIEDGTDPDPGILPTLASIQQNVFTPICSACHFPGGATPMPLDTEDNSYASLVGPDGLTCGIPRVSPGLPDQSCIVWKIEGNGNYSGTDMPPPPRSPLSQEEIDAIREWIELGAAR